jgi:hypothetical protein
MLVGIAAAVGLPHGVHESSAVYVWSVPGAQGPMMGAPSPGMGGDMIPVVVSTGGQAAKDAFPYGAPTSEFTVAPGADLTFTVTMDVPPGDDLTDASLIAAPGSFNSWSLAGSLPVVDSQPITAGAVNTFTVQWNGSAQDLTPGSQWTLVLATAGLNDSAQAPIAEITVSG